MLKIGSFVEFVWWSSYRARSIYKDTCGYATWYELNPGDKGVILEVLPESEYSVLFTKVSGIPLLIHGSMLKLA